MRNALMGNTCYVVATVTAADWRMTVGFRALLMAVCRRPSPSRSLIPVTGSLIWIHLPSPGRPFGIGCPPFSRRIALHRVALRDVRRLRRQIIYGISFFAPWFRPSRARDADRERGFYFERKRERKKERGTSGKIDRDRTARDYSFGRLNVSRCGAEKVT